MKSNFKKIRQKNHLFEKIQKLQKKINKNSKKKMQQLQKKHAAKMISTTIRTISYGALPNWPTLLFENWEKWA